MDLTTPDLAEPITLHYYMPNLKAILYLHDKLRLPLQRQEQHPPSQEMTDKEVAVTELILYRIEELPFYNFFSL